ncbi:MAG: hypothetical protein K9J06_12630 [Flavobacteriales bacterium]|nr:hypothetical protein [Flavobacteriales bacterium]
MKYVDIRSVQLLKHQQHAMAKRDYFPVQLGDQRKWLIQYKNAVMDNGAAMGMTPEEVVANMTAADSQIDAIDTVIDAERAYKSALSARKAGAKGHIGRIRRSIKHFKTSSNYSIGTARLIGAIGPEDILVPDEYVPNGNVKPMPDSVVVRFKKKGVDAMAIYCRVLDDEVETSFVRIGIFINSPFEDTTPLSHPNRPEKRLYRLRGVVNDKEVGQFSDTMEVVAVG